jgi:hypothetical protein
MGSIQMWEPMRDDWISCSKMSLNERKELKERK